MPENYQVNEVAIAEFTREASQRAIEIVTERVEREAAHLAPRLNLARTRPPGEGWSLPPGNLARSVGHRYGTDIDGKPYGEIVADPVYRFHKKKRHAVYPAIDVALDMQYGKPVP